jgi:hypothetical protein
MALAMERLHVSIGRKAMCNSFYGRPESRVTSKITGMTSELAGKINSKQIFSYGIQLTNASRLIKRRSSKVA